MLAIIAQRHTLVCNLDKSVLACCMICVHGYGGTDCRAEGSSSQLSPYLTQSLANSFSSPNSTCFRGDCISFSPARLVVARERERPWRLFKLAAPRSHPSDVTSLCVLVMTPKSTLP